MEGYHFEEVGNGMCKGGVLGVLLCLLEERGEGDGAPRLLTETR